MSRQALAFIEMPRQLVQFCAELAPLLSRPALFYARRPETRSLLRGCGYRPFPEHANLPAADTPTTLTLDRYKGGDLHPDWRRRAARLERSLQAFLDAADVGALFVWNGSGLTAAVAVELARRRGLPVIFGENGYLPGTLQLDARGVNYFSSLTSVVAADAYRGARLDADEQRALDTSLAVLRGEALRLPPTPPRQRIRASAIARLQRELSRPIAPDRWQFHPRPLSFAATELPKRRRPYVFLPLQVMGDSQLIQHSPLLGADMPGFVRHVADALTLTAPEQRLVVKLHPAERRHQLGVYRRLAAADPRITWLRDIPATQLAAGASGVVTINSTVGFEALALRKPVVTLGRNFYCFAPLVHPVDSLESLPQILRAAIDTPVDAEARGHFLAYAWRHVLVAASYRDFSPASLRAVADRCEALIAAPELG